MPPPKYLSGDSLWGDDFEPSQIAEWFDDEELGYYNLAVGHFGNVTADGEGLYEYQQLNEFHAFSKLKQRKFDLCVALGCAGGADVAPLAPVVQRFVGVEPAKTWWRDRIGDKPARFVSPSPSGDLAFTDGEADLLISLGVLHHIPNVAQILGEAARVLSPGGLIVIREPISSMGRWWEPRVGLTARERGIPDAWLKKQLIDKGFEIVRFRHCMFAPLGALAGKCGLKNTNNKRAYVWLDWILSTMFSFNISYYRPSLLKKFAPGAVFVIACKK